MHGFSDYGGLRYSTDDTIVGASRHEFAGLDKDTVIKATCLTILTGGLETHVTLTWALSALLNNPKALKMAQDELDVHVGRDRLVEESDIKNLVYLQAIIKETMRLYPPSPIPGTHESMDDCVVAGYNIPKGTRLMVNVWKLHRDPNVWSDPNQFRPERFLTSHMDIDYKGQQYEFLPFGSDRRMCVGASFALTVLHFTLASLIQAFELSKPSKDPVDMSKSVGLTNIKDFPLEVILGPR
ncbi:cytochrome P450 CYP82D47-like protein, partial [Tanacetum coccineum]